MHKWQTFELKKLNMIKLDRFGPRDALGIGWGPVVAEFRTGVHCTDIVAGREHGDKAPSVCNLGIVRH